MAFYKKNIFVFCIALAILFPSITIADNNKTDSLLQKLNAEKIDSAKINLLNAISSELVSQSPQRAIDYANQALEIAQRIENNLKISQSLLKLGVAEKAIGNYEKALKNYEQSEAILNDLEKKISVNNEIKSMMAEISIHKGMALSEIGEYEKSLTLFLNTLQILEGLDQTPINHLNKNSAFISIGNVFFAQKKFDNAIEYYQKAVTISKEAKNSHAISIALGNIGIVYGAKNELDTAAIYFRKQLELNKQTGNKSSMATALGNLGIVYTYKKNYSTALEYQLKSLEIAKELEDKRLIAYALHNIGQTHTSLLNISKAINYMEESIKIASEIQQRELLADNYKGMSEAYSVAEKYKESNKYLQQYLMVKDTLFNETSSKQMAEMQTKYETEKKAKEITLLNKDKELQKTQLNKQQIIIWFVVVGLLLTGTSAFISYRGFMQKKKANILLETKNIMIEKQRNEILASINYAKNIQKSMLMREEEIQKILPFENFIFYRPKDIVSGDFYWFSKQENKYLMAAVDCTGHGVPGGFMSMIGNSLLNEIVLKMKITRPSEILSTLNVLIRETLRQTTDYSHAQDGMDMALCSIDIQNRILEYSGARNPLYIISSTLSYTETEQIKYFPIENNKDAGLYVIKADSFSIGGKNPSILRGKEKTYTNHEFPLTPDTNIYLFSDGYIDQYGGTDKKKLGSPRFRDILLNLWNKNSIEQKEKLASEISDWQGIHKQIDDMLVIGIKI